MTGSVIGPHFYLGIYPKVTLQQVSNLSQPKIFRYSQSLFQWWVQKWACCSVQPTCMNEKSLEEFLRLFSLLEKKKKAQGQEGFHNLHKILRAATAMLSPRGRQPEAQVNIQRRQGRELERPLLISLRAEPANPRTILSQNFLYCTTFLFLRHSELGFTGFEIEHNLIKSHLEKDWSRVAELAI